jgi:hypothetical protein
MTPKRIDLADDLAFADTSHGRIATHLGNDAHVHGDQQNGASHGSGGRCGFATGVTGTNYYDIISFHRECSTWNRSTVSRKLDRS